MRFVLIIGLVVFLLHAVAMIGVLGYGLATGRFDGEKRQQYLATWRGEKLVAPIEKEEEAKEQESPQQASVRIESREVEKEITSREIQRQMEVLKNMEFTLEIFQGKLEEQRLKLDGERNQFAQKLEQQQESARDEGFQKALKTYTGMKPKYVKEDFMKMADEEVVNYLAAMKADAVTKILNQFKTQEEQDKRRRVIKLLQEQKMIQFNNASDKGKLAS